MEFDELLEECKRFMETSPDSLDTDYGSKILLEVRSAGSQIIDNVEREKFTQIARDIGERLFELTGEYFSTRLAPLAILPSNGELQTNVSPFGRPPPSQLSHGIAVTTLGSILAPDNARDEGTSPGLPAGYLTDELAD